TGILMSSITTIIDAISYVLIAFVSVSLVVSSIMIAIITYISVLERTKEIGILRALGASKKDVKRVFNAETFIIGLISGVMGIAVTMILIVPINKIIRSATEIQNIGAVLPSKPAMILIVIAVVLTIIAGLIPSSMASRCDPVTALRSE
ncbi:MAG: FtsX-like permease family protein, partial [Erysipelotrichaceae bacterium]|nr:FtsX-like permease family protein [Erysipelotrichaceae bacterium]